MFPKIKCKYPTDADGNLIPHKLPDEQLANYGGVLGHYHIQTNKNDPGPAFQWDYVIGGARKLLPDSGIKKILLSPRLSESAAHSGTPLK